jgi:raffinose/stachyose/melibiose transport system permease protein
MKQSKARFWIFLAPALISFTVVVLIPMLIGFFYAFTNWNGIVGSEIEFVGFQNFIDIFTRDDSFLHAFGFTALFSVCAVVLVNLVGFGLAMLVTQTFKGATFLRAVFFMPNLIGGLLLGFTWQFIFVSIFEAIAKATGWEIFSGWLADPQTGFVGLLILTVWQLSGYMMIVYIAQIQQIPESVKEAASIDGRERMADVEEHYTSADDAGIHDRIVPLHFQFI